MAQLSAHGGARVILEDCDLRQLSLIRKLVPNAAAGLFDVVTDSASLSLEEVI
jgi:succinoglycan biosynthesis transport protein ExoP